jgi:hypothetical protein
MKVVRRLCNVDTDIRLAPGRVGADLKDTKTALIELCAALGIEPDGTGGWGGTPSITQLISEVIELPNRKPEADWVETPAWAADCLFKGLIAIAKEQGVGL